MLCCLPTAAQRSEPPVETELHTHDFNQVIWNLLKTSINQSHHCTWQGPWVTGTRPSTRCHILQNFVTSFLRTPLKCCAFPEAPQQWRMCAPETNTHFCQSTNASSSARICLQLLNNTSDGPGSTAGFIFLSLNSADLVSTTFNMKSYLASIFFKYTRLFVLLFSRIVEVLKALNLPWAFDKICVSHSPTQINKMIL